MIKNHNLLDRFCYVYLYLSIVNFNLCKYFKHFGRVEVDVNSVESLDKLNLFFNHCKYCNSVELVNCKLIGDLKLDPLIRHIR